MKIRLNHLLFMICAVLAPGTLLTTGRTVLAVAPSAQDLPRIHDLAGRLYNNTTLLAQRSREQQHHYDENEQSAIDRFERLNTAAEHFYRTTSRPNVDPGQTQADFDDLRAAYRQARDSFGTIHATGDVQQAIGQVHDAMRDLVRYYGGGEQGYGNYPAHQGAYDYDQLRRISSDIVDRTDQLEERARRNNDGEPLRDSLARLNEAARNFNGQVDKYHGDVGHIDEEYVTLANRLFEARTRYNTNDTQVIDGLRDLQGQVARLNYIAPNLDINNPHAYSGSPNDQYRYREREGTDRHPDHGGGWNWRDLLPKS